MIACGMVKQCMVNRLKAEHTQNAYNIGELFVVLKPEYSGRSQSIPGPWMHSYNDIRGSFASTVYIGLERRGWIIIFYIFFYAMIH